MEEQLRPGCGILPAAAPLANPYVPFQQYDPNTYGAKTGLVRGTLFPGLDLPFLGMVNREEKPDTPMHELQALHFAIAELGLYLDTHPEDAQATELFREYAELYKTGYARYEQTYGPLCQKDAAQSGRYTWTQGPWPWEYEQED